MALQVFTHALHHKAPLQVCQGQGLTCLSALFSAPAELGSTSLLLGGMGRLFPEPSITCTSFWSGAAWQS